MYHLPAYLALERWVLARRVVVVQPTGPEGPRRLLSAGARQVLVIGADFPSEPGMEVRPSAGPRLPLREDSVDLVICIEAFGALRSTDRRELLRESYRALRSDGIFCAWIEQRESEAFGRTLVGSSQLDFWGLEDQIGAIFPRVDMLAQMPWQGFSMAPILDDEAVEAGQDPVLALREELLEEAPEASHYLAVASKTRVPAGLVRECLLIPLPRGEVFGFDPRAERDGAELEELRDELDRLREELSLRAAKVAAAHGRVRELESQLDSLRARTSEVEASELERLRDGLTEAETQLSILRARGEEQSSQRARLEDERVVLLAQIETARSEHSSLGADVASTEAEQRASLDQLRDQLRDQAQVAETETRAAEDRARTAEQTLTRQSTDLQVLTRTSAEQDKAVARLTAQLEGERSSLEDQRGEVRGLRERLESLDAEREELRRQNEVSVAEREGARKLAQRMEAELEVARRRADQQDQALAASSGEASRLAGELEAQRRRIDEAESALAQTRSKAEELTASAAQGAEQGRILADVAVDRDRLREELTQRGRQFEALEGRMWETREALQKERLEGVRVASEVERLREQVERSRAEEQKRVREVEALGRELRGVEVAKAEGGALLRVREEQITRLESEAKALVGQSVDVEELRDQLSERNREVSSLAEELAGIEAREERSGAALDARERELETSQEKILGLQIEVERHSASEARTKGELEVRQLEVRQLAATVEDLQAELEDARESGRQRALEKAAVQQQLEEAAAVRDSLRRQLLDSEHELDRLSHQPEPSSGALIELRRDLELAAEVAAKLESGDGGEGPSREELGRWPAGARREVERLRRALADSTRTHARAIAAVQVSGAGGADERLRKLRLEVEVRTTEQEYMLAQLDGAEQNIWEMTDASDRNAARLAASLAQLEKHKETVDSLLDELEVTRNLLAAEQARALEQERLLASERAKMARAGVGVESPANPDDPSAGRDPFTALGGRALLDLSEGESEAGGRPQGSVAAGKKPQRSNPGDARLRPTASELDQTLASLDDDDGDERVLVDSSGGPVPGRVSVPEPRPASLGSVQNPGSGITVEVVDDDEWPEE